MFWPGINADIEQLCKQCETCRKNQQDPPFSSNTSATVEAHYPGEVYGADVADIQGRHHLVVIDYYSTCIFEQPLPSLTSASIILAFKTIFADTGIPSKLITDLLLYPTPTSMLDVTTITSCAVKHDTVTLPFAAGTLS